MNRIKIAHLSKLKELASNFDADEREVVLSCIPKDEMRAYLEREKPRSIEEIIQSNTK